MPNFKTHRGFNYLLFIVGCMILNHFSMFNIYIMIVLAIGFVLGTEFITPDLDVSSIPSKRGGILWIPYKLLFKHRQSSHSLFFGVVGRMIYLTILIIILIVIIGLLLKNPDVLMQTFELINWSIVFLLFLGIWVANAIHILLDKIA